MFFMEINVFSKETAYYYHNEESRNACQKQKETFKNIQKLPQQQIILTAKKERKKKTLKG